MSKAKVAVVVGSEVEDSLVTAMTDVLQRFGISHEVTVAGAHRSPDRVHRYAVVLEERGVQVVIACAGGAAHLAGMLAAHTILPVIGVPADTSPLQGLDALVSTAMMPAGIPVAAMGIGAEGAANAAILAAQILARSDEELAERLREYKKTLAEQEEEKDREGKKIRNG